MTSIWTPNHLQTATHGTWHGKAIDANKQLGQISIDTRTLQKGDVYIALKGHALDGHDFISQALQAGASVIIGSQSINESHLQHTYLQVKDTLKAFEDLGQFAREHIDAKRIAITGSVGKTSVKELLQHMLSQFGSTWASPKSFNNLWGVPFTLSNMPRETKYGIFEIGTNAVGEVAPLTQQVQPNIALLTTIGIAHRANFPKPEDLTIEKCALFRGLNNNGIAVVPTDCETAPQILQFAKQSNAAKVCSFGTSPAADFVIKTFKATPTGLELTYEVDKKTIHGTVPTHGYPWVYNIGAALCVIDLLGLDCQKALNSLDSFQEPVGRGRQLMLSTANAPDGRFLLIDQAYNANPHSMAAALKTFQEIPLNTDKNGQRIAIIGDMFELGTEEQTQSHHMDIAKSLDPKRIQTIITVGQFTKQLNDALCANFEACYHFDTINDLPDFLLNIVKDGDHVMIKGGNGMRFTKVVEDIISKSNALHNRPTKQNTPANGSA